MTRLLTITVLLLALLTACKNPVTPADEENPIEEVDEGEGDGDDEEQEGDGVTSRNAVHRFVQVGASVPLAGLGAVLDAGSFDNTSPLVLASDKKTVRCEDGGAGWVRLRYRDDVTENKVQTLVVVCIDEVGDCMDLPRLSADLEKYRAGSVIGAADLLAAGNGDLWAVCRSATSVRLQQPPALPPLMFRVVDAWGGGPYSVSNQELTWLRASTVVNYSGSTHRPQWIATIGRHITAISLASDGSVNATFTPCSQSPECPDNASWLESGDLLIISLGAPNLENVVAAVPPNVQQSFAESHVPGLWDVLGNVSETAPNYTARDVLLYRLIGLDLMNQIVTDFDTRLQLGARTARIGFGGFWQARSRIPCLPHEQETCDEAEEVLSAYEAATINAWRARGMQVWWTDFLGYEMDGSYRTLSMPDYHAFDGVFALLDVGATANPGVDRAAALANSIRTLAAEVPSSLPVAFSVHWGPMEHVLQMGGFCEGEICPSAFTAYYAAFEPALVAMVESFAPGRVVGFGVPMFDGAHFDVKSPYESLSGLILNRVAETGFNNPLMNLYSAR